MIRSMTGYGAAAAETPLLQATATVRSLNHRYLDLGVRLSRSVAALEPSLKEVVQSYVGRGKVDVSLQATFVLGTGVARVVSHSFAGEVIEALRALRDRHGLAGELTAGDVARFGVIEVVEVPAVLTPEQQETLLAVVRQAMSELVRMREQEGANLAADLTRRLTTIEDATLRIEAAMEESREARISALREKVQALVAELGLEEGRLHQEIVRFVDRQDTSEETTRLRSHVALARTLLEGGEAVGKRLDFLAQELAREANTIGSKAASTPVVHEVVALKAEIEKLREQVQNVE
jgi:uncharacterized protein (TIGR00255 family)